MNARTESPELNRRINTLIMRGMSVGDAERQARAEFADAVAGRVLADPWTHEMNTDGGAAAADFIRNARARNARSQAEKDASRAANVARVLAAMGR